MTSGPHPDALRIDAAVCHEFGAPLRVEPVLLDPPGADEVLVEIHACAICASDLHAGNGSWGGELPAVNGHEASGTVRQVGARVTSVSVGDRVVVTLLRSCRSCFHCEVEAPHLCTGRDGFDIAGSTRLHALDGVPIVQGVYTGAFADAVVVHHSQLAVVPDTVPFEAAALLACGVATGYGAATKTEPVDPGSTVAVIGAGGVGLNAIQGARARGAAQIIAVDTSDTKLADAAEFGASHTIDVSVTDPATAVAELTERRGADKVYVTVGAVAAVEQGMELCRNGGAIVVVGMTANDQSARVDTSGFAASGKRLVGSFMGSTHVQRDIPRLADAYLAGELLLDELVTGRYPLARINDALASTAAGSARRNVVVVDR